MIRFIVALVIVAMVSPAMAKAVPGDAPPSRVSRLVAAAVPKPPKDTSDIPILQQIQAWTQDALADANQNQDKIAATCYSAIIEIINVKLAANQPNIVNPILIFQKIRDITRLNSSNLGTSLIVGCAPLAQDSGVTFIQFFTNMGALVILKGILPIP